MGKSQRTFVHTKLARRQDALADTRKSTKKKQKETRQNGAHRIIQNYRSSWSTPETLNPAAKTKTDNSAQQTKKNKKTDEGTHRTIKS
jgi:hypothetical protein